MYSSFVNELMSTLMLVYTSFANKNDLNKKTLNSIYYVDIKLEELRNILKTILRNIRTINLNEDKSIVKLFFDLVA